MTTTYRNQGDGIPIIDKAPNAVLDYLMQWTDWLAAGETISGNVVTTDTGIVAAPVTATSTTVTVWLSGGTTKVTYLVTIRITTSAGRTDERSFRVNVIKR